MNIWKLGLGLVLLDFVALTLWAVVTGGGVQGLIAVHTDAPWALQIGADLILALSMVSLFLWRDAKARGTNPVPWIVATVFTGSIAPLTYLLLRPSAGTETAPASVAADSGAHASV